MWYFMNKLKPKEQRPLSIGEAFEFFCQGISTWGPFWDHVLGYWKLSQESPYTILFLKYEDLEREPTVYVKRLAMLLVQPFTIEEERDDVAQKITEFCSFENLSNLEINKSGVQQFSTELAIENTNFFRKGEVGDGKNHLTNEMIERIDHITQQKFNGSGLISGAFGSGKSKREVIGNLVSFSLGLATTLAILGVQAYLDGLSFALVASPCSTPVLATLLGYLAASKALLNVY
ncbi:hypothetical protein ACSBR2_041746 [Camellia fascicularis]